ncbi:hypothetical protein LP52_19410 [Streptomonospora alba]|uniref:Uncharacterized protein n=1 Tax=Streptomonospora alba TaxID=183763 RepID=A0A0C2J7L3_9ACTN|nr:hypothetical protein LP52_19410 [Streptomonospora alba]
MRWTPSTSFAAPAGVRVEEAGTDEPGGRTDVGNALAGACGCGYFFAAPQRWQQMSSLSGLL